MFMFIDVSELPGFAAGDSWMVEDAEAMAMLAAPCLAELSAAVPAEALKLKAVKAILRGALLRWKEAGTGALTQRSQGAGSFQLSESIDTRQQRKNMFWPSELEQLRGLCSLAVTSGTASTIDPSGVIHLPWCASSLGAAYCSCGSDIAGSPIFELDGWD